MVEVYNESVYDLLVSPEEGHEKLQLQKKGNDVIAIVSTTYLYSNIINLIRQGILVIGGGHCVIIIFIGSNGDRSSQYGGCDDGVQ